MNSPLPIYERKPLALKEEQIQSLLFCIPTGSMGKLHSELTAATRTIQRFHLGWEGEGRELGTLQRNFILIKAIRNPLDSRSLRKCQEVKHKERLWEIYVDENRGEKLNRIPQDLFQLQKTAGIWTHHPGFIAKLLALSINFFHRK